MKSDNDTSNGHQLYVKVADMIEQEITDGRYRAGEKMQPVRGLCRQYEVSNRTAAKAVQELIGRGVLKSIPRKGTFVNVIPTVSVSQHEAVPLERVVLICNYSVKNSKHSFISEIAEEVFRQANRAGLNFRTELCSESDLKNMMTLPFNPKRSDGLIIISGRPSLLMMALLGTVQNRCVMVDSVSPYAPSVLNDNHAGMRQALQHLKALGHRKVALAWGMNRKPNFVNENERREGFLQAVDALSLDGEIVEGKKAEDFVGIVKRADGPTALMFTKDDPALEFIKLAQAQGIRIPKDLSVTGFDDFSQHDMDLSALTTIRTNRQEIGKQAFVALRDLVYAGEPCCCWHRIPCELIIRQSTAQRGK